MYSYPVRFREQLLSDFNNRGEVEVVPVNGSVINPVKRRIKPCCDIDNGCMGVLRCTLLPYRRTVLLLS